MIAIYRLSRRFPDMDEDGEASLDNWMAITDIGRIYHGQRLELSEFLEVENAMVEEVYRMLVANKVDRLSVLWDGWLSEPFIREKERLIGIEPRKLIDHKSGKCLNFDEISVAIRLILREVGGTAMTDYKNFYLCPLFDFALQIGTTNIDTMRKYKTKSSLLFLKHMRDVPTEGELWEEEYKQFLPNLAP